MLTGLVVITILNCPSLDLNHLALAGQQRTQASASLPLTMAQIRDLLSVPAPDETLAGELDARGVSFDLNDGVVSEIADLGAGPKTLAALSSLRASGILVVTTQGPGDRVFVDAAPVGTTDGDGRLRVRVAVGEHEVSVTRSPSVSAPSVRRTLEPGRESAVAFTFEIPPVRVGGNIKPPARLKHVEPAYPADARAARRQGTVILELVLNPNGTVRTATALRPIPMLTDAAIEAAKQWVFEPTTLNGVPVPVVLTATVPFSLQ